MTYLSQIYSEINFIIFCSPRKGWTLPPALCPVDCILWRMSPVLIIWIAVIARLSLFFHSIQLIKYLLNSSFDQYLDEIDVNVLGFVQPIGTDQFTVELRLGNILTTGRGRTYLQVFDNLISI